MSLGRHREPVQARTYGLPEGVTLTPAVDTVWTLNSPMIHDRLVRRCGWTPAAYEEWLAAQVLTCLAGSPGSAPAPAG